MWEGLYKVDFEIRNTVTKNFSQGMKMQVSDKQRTETCYSLPQ